MDEDVASTNVSKNEKFRHDSDALQNARQDGNAYDDLYLKTNSETEINFTSVEKSEYWRDGKKYYNKWAWLEHVDKGVNSRQRHTQNREEDIKRCIKMFLDCLSKERKITDYHEQRVTYVLNSMDNLNMGGLSYETTILGTISLVLDEEVNMVNGVRIRRTESWGQLLNDMNTEKSEIKRVRNKVRDYL